MKRSVAARLPAARVVGAVLRDGVTLDAALRAALPAVAVDLAATVRSLAYGAVRGFFRHEKLLAKLLTHPAGRLDPLPRAVLAVALYELQDRRSPDYAVVDAAVDAARAAAGPGPAGLVNAVLRRYLRERPALDAAIARDPDARYAAPAWLGARLRSEWPDHAAQVLAALDGQAPMWLRVDARRTTAEAYVASLRQAGLGARTEPRVPYAVLLDTPCDVQALPGFAQGLVSVQDLAAQCVAVALDLRAHLRVLDACAAPGGKTALIAERQPALRELLAVDVDPVRLERLRENLQRGALGAATLAADAAAPRQWWDGVPFDRILLDAPCSGLGVIRRHPDIRLRKSPADLDKLPLLQGRLLRACWSMLASGGRLVYATCTFVHAENGGLLQRFLHDTSDAEHVPPQSWQGRPDLGITDLGGWQILPGEAGADGFYYAALKKR
ncbi:MAG TPA: 16S rRNA (cytosine(967)-C(5))-methyltransferase RsmB [Steroidobacteraceae bacterium]|nr:16S rRNA (cytosine(967)-C(5))-methyltransferase RsmB [Steroidobacteraceae bacterium]